MKSYRNKRKKETCLYGLYINSIYKQIYFLNVVINSKGNGSTFYETDLELYKREIFEQFEDWED